MQPGASSNSMLKHSPSVSTSAMELGRGGKVTRLTMKYLMGDLPQRAPCFYQNPPPLPQIRCIPSSLHVPPSPSEVIWSRCCYIDQSNQHHVLAARRKQPEGCRCRHESSAW